MYFAVVFGVTGHLCRNKGPHRVYHLACPVSATYLVWSSADTVSSKFLQAGHLKSSTETIVTGASAWPAKGTSARLKLTVVPSPVGVVDCLPRTANRARAIRAAAIGSADNQHCAVVIVPESRILPTLSSLKRASLAGSVSSSWFYPLFEVAQSVHISMMTVLF